MSSHPDWEWVEQVRFGAVHNEAVALPPSHTEGLEAAEGTSVADVARSLYNNDEWFGAGLRQEWEQIVPEENREDAFAQAYFAYLLYPDSLRAEQPGRYDFLREHIFYGAEFARPDSVVPEGQELPQLAYLDYDTQGRQIEVTGNGTWVVSTGEKIG